MARTADNIYICVEKKSPLQQNRKSFSPSHVGRARYFLIKRAQYKEPIRSVCIIVIIKAAMPDIK